MKNTYLRYLTLLPIILYVILVANFSENIPFEDDYGVFLEKSIMFSNPNISIFTKLTNVVTYYIMEHKMSFIGALTYMNIALFKKVNILYIIYFGNLVFISGYLFVWVKNKNIYALLISSLIYFSYQNLFMSFSGTASLENSFVLLFGFAAIFSSVKKQFLLSVLFSFLAIETYGGGLAILPTILIVYLVIDKLLFKRYLFYVICEILYFLSLGPDLNPGGEFPNKLQLFIENPFSIVNFFMSITGSYFEFTGYWIIAGVLCFCGFLFLTSKKYYKTNPLVYYILVYMLAMFALISISRTDNTLLANGALALRFKTFTIVFTSFLFFGLVEISNRVQRSIVLALIIISSLISIPINYNFAQITHKSFVNRFRENSFDNYCSFSNITTMAKFDEGKRFLYEAIENNLYSPKWELSNLDKKGLFEAKKNVRLEVVQYYHYSRTLTEKLPTEYDITDTCRVIYKPKFQKINKIEQVLPIVKTHKIEKIEVSEASVYTVTLADYNLKSYILAYNNKFKLDVKNLSVHQDTLFLDGYFSDSIQNYHDIEFFIYQFSEKETNKIKLEFVLNSTISVKTKLKDYDAIMLVAESGNRIVFLRRLKPF